MLHIKHSTVTKVKKILLCVLFCLNGAMNLLNGKGTSSESLVEVFKEIFTEAPVKLAAAEAAGKGKMAVATHA